MNVNEIIKTIEKYGLAPSSKRDLPFFIFSCVPTAYTHMMRKRFGFSYEAVAAIGSKNKFHTLLNDEHVSNETQKILDNKFDELFNEIFPALMKDLKALKKEFEKIHKNIKSHPLESLTHLIELYPPFLCILGFYNCFHRYIGNQESKDKISPELAKKIGLERDYIARLYPLMETDFEICANAIGKETGFDGNLLKYMSITEIRPFLKTKKLSQEQIAELKKRKKEYFFIYTEEEAKEHIYTDEDLVKKMDDKYFKIDDTDVKTFKGFSAYPGIVKGYVHVKGNKDAEDNFILITTMTHPDDVPLIKKCSAIVTDEGGMLSHVAVIARELKKPCIIGTKIATSVLKQGDYIEVDADKSVVRKLK